MLPSWMTPAQIGDLTPNQASALTTGELQILTPSQIAALTPAAISALSNAQLGALSSNQIAALTASQISALNISAAPEELLLALGASQLQALTNTQIVALSTNTIESFSTAQIAALLPSQISSLSAEQLAAFSNSQLSAITLTQSQSLGFSQLVDLSQDQFIAFTQSDFTASGAPVAGGLADATGVDFVDPMDDAPPTPPPTTAPTGPTGPGDPGPQPNLAPGVYIGFRSPGTSGANMTHVWIEIVDADGNATTYGYGPDGGNLVEMGAAYNDGTATASTMFLIPPPPGVSDTAYAQSVAAVCVATDVYLDSGSTPYSITTDCYSTIAGMADLIGLWPNQFQAMANINASNAGTLLAEGVDFVASSTYDSTGSATRITAGIEQILAQEYGPGAMVSLTSSAGVTFAPGTTTFQQALTNGAPVPNPQPQPAPSPEDEDTADDCDDAAAAMLDGFVDFLKLPQGHYDSYGWLTIGSVSSLNETLGDSIPDSEQGDVGFFLGELQNGDLGDFQGGTSSAGPQQRLSQLQLEQITQGTVLYDYVQAYKAVTQGAES
ncbi:MAG: hypothetical protein WCC70_04560 [Candidatus Aquilonibacter sp.]